MPNNACPLCHRNGRYSETKKRLECPNEGCEVAFFGPVHERELPKAGGVFPARYPGYCHGCGDRFLEGDLVGFHDDEIHCEGCVQALGGKEPKPVEVCQTCFMAKAANGSCGCD